NLIPPYKGTLFSKRGRAWLEAQPLAEDQRRVVLRHAGELDRLGGELAQVDKSLAKTALQEPRVKRLMTITGVDVTVALSIVAAVGDIERFSSPEKLVSYFGLNPRVRQSGDKPAYHGRITKQGRAHARSMLVEAAWVISGVPGPLRAFFMRIRGARAPHMRCDDHRLRDRVATSTLLFATRSPEPRKNSKISFADPSRSRRTIATCSLRLGQAAHTARWPAGQP
ncbi:MAG: IS110 family transposase, partial [Mesorhizobium sp.]